MQIADRTEANIAIVKEAYAAFFRGDVDGILKLGSADIDWESIGPGDEFPLFGPRHGRAAVGEFFVQNAELLTFSLFEPRQFVAAGDDVVVLGHYAFTMHRTGRMVETDWAMVFTIRGGEIVRFREHTDTAQFVAAYRS
jgi:ketosteroid isomerase-like protein